MTRKRIILTGAGGFVAGSIIAQAGEAVELHAASRGAPILKPALALTLPEGERDMPGRTVFAGAAPVRSGSPRTEARAGGSEQLLRPDAIKERAGPRWHRLLQDDSAGWRTLFDSVQPDAVIHTAAVADIDFCQANPGICRQINVEFTRSLARLCAERGAKLVFCSTDTVFDGEHAPYREEDPVGPVNLYAESKVEAEKTVAGSGAQHVIARLALVVGLPVLGAGNSFVAKVLANLRAGRAVTVPANEIRTPLDVITLGRALLELAAGPVAGVVHLAGNERLNRLEINRRIAARFGFSGELILPSAAADFIGRAQRPRDVSLDNSRARRELQTPMLGLDAALERIPTSHFVSREISP